MQTQPLELIFWILIVVIGVVLYALPAIIAIWTQHPRRLAITLLTVLLGWTLIGWFALLLWSLNDEYMLETVSGEQKGERRARST